MISCCLRLVFTATLALGSIAGSVASAQEVPAAPVAPQSPVPPETPQPPGPEVSQPPAVPQIADQDDSTRLSCHGWGHNPTFRLGQSHHVRRDEVTRDVTTIFGSVLVEGRVCGDLVVVFGQVELTGDAVVEGSLVSVGGSVTATPGTTLHGDLVVVGGLLDAPAAFGAGHERVVIGVPFVGDRLLGVLPWITRGLLYGRLIVPDLAWIWYVVAVTLFVLFVLNLLFPRAASMSASAIGERPLSTFGAGMLVLLLSGPVVTLLAVSVIGVVVIPVLLCALVAAALVGTIAVARWIGTRLVEQSDPADRGQSTRSLLIGFVVLCIAFMIPLIGITVWALTSVLGLGAATLAFIGAFRAEYPRPLPPPPPPPGGAPRVIPSGAAAALSEPHVALEHDPGATWTPESPPASSHTLEPPPGTDLRGLPRGRFLERMAAFVLDVLLVGIVSGVVGLSDRGGWFLILLFAYHVVFWAWKASTVGGIICQLRLVRVDGESLRVVDALVRGFTGVLSLGALGLGFLWVLFDPEQQSWHDKVAGTLVVRVPRSWPLP